MMTASSSSWGGTPTSFLTQKPVNFYTASSGPVTCALRHAALFILLCFLSCMIRFVTFFATEESPFVLPSEAVYHVSYTQEPTNTYI